MQAGLQDIAATMNPGIIATGLGIAEAVFIDAGTANDAGFAGLLPEHKEAMANVLGNTDIFDLSIEILTGNKFG